MNPQLFCGRGAALAAPADRSRTMPYSVDDIIQAGRHVIPLIVEILHGPIHRNDTALSRGVFM